VRSIVSAVLSTVTRRTGSVVFGVGDGAAGDADVGGSSRSAIGGVGSAIGAASIGDGGGLGAVDPVGAVSASASVATGGSTRARGDGPRVETY
jgi:hypothetical protein